MCCDKDSTLFFLTSTSRSTSSTIVTVDVGGRLNSLCCCNGNGGDNDEDEDAAAIVTDDDSISSTTTEGSETFQVQIRTGSVSGTVVDTTNVITINDTSLTPAGFVPDYTLSIGFPGAGLYSVSGTDRTGSVSGNNIPLAFNQGDKVRFNNSVYTGHPLYVKTVQGTGNANGASGVDGQGTAVVDWTVGADGTYYYQCTIHNAMHSDITVT